MQSPNSEIVANVHDDLNIFLRNDLNQAPQKFRGARTSGKYRVVASHPDILRGAQCWRPEIQDTCGNDVPKVIDFAFGRLSFEQAEYSAADDLSIGGVFFFSS